MSGCKHQDRPRVTEVCRDDAAVLALAVTRYVAAGYMTGDVACWDAAHDGAERVLGEADGPAFVAAITSLMRAIRAERLADWSFMPASCCRVTPHEEQLLALLALARSPAGGEVAAAAARLAGVPSAPRLVRAAGIAADRKSVV